MGLRLDIVTPERELFTGEVDTVLVPGAEGQLGILPQHAPLITVLDEGVLTARRGAESLAFAIHGGYMQVLSDHVIVLADVAEQAEEIDVERAEEARRRAEELLKKQPPPEEQRAAMAALQRSLVRLRVARRQRPYRPEREPES
ncbi:MAG: F0F1 ATP synthase subunit epsilon [Anaerolineae bacterium]|nr:F0F1 ATP synthase subunit epsilon [Anaerolineae bacterium]